ncbi:uncharacterized protein LOC132101422 isoform X1 [Carassius carassius]|uniref:uncharacterized protein LOC132101422 isoform X1 n=1 Tax=Carassius carassius TaxID=217509 RepID=UPI0028686BBF|nr:uncharacterized protein LOC132101422 isoform X1 [Carassius carassius]
MMFRCFVCKSSFVTVQMLIRHLKVFHAFYPGKKFQLMCYQAGCHQRFWTFSGFRKHLHIKHRAKNLDQFENEPIIVENEPVIVDVADDVNLIPEQPENSQSCNETRQHTQEMCASLIANLQSCGVATNVITTVVENMEELVEELHSNVKDDVVKLLSNDEEIRTKFDDYFDNLENPFSKLNTEAKRKKHFSEKWGIVEPVEVALGVRYDARRNRTTGTYDQVPITDKFVYIPLLQTLKFIFTNQEICDHFVQPCEKTGFYKDFCDGNYFRDHPLFSEKPNSLQIQIFYDDFEMANPLGSKHGIHKVGSIYFVLRNLSPKINSALMNIHLLALFHTEDVKKYGFDLILQPLVRDLKILECTGIEVPFSDEPVYGTIAQVTGDNLGLHSLLGYVESFSANNFCRFCLVDKQTSQTVFRDDDPRITLRNKALHDQHCNDLMVDPTLPSTFGVKRQCLFNDLQYFHVSENYAVDIMHDILEGVGQFELKLLFAYLSDNKIISKTDVCNRIYSYNYGFVERKNRPTRINLEQNGNGIGLNAIQTFCLIRNMPLIFGDVLREGNAHYRLLLLLLQIMNIILSPVVTDGMTVCLKHLIVDHHQLFKELYPHRRMIPKHHFMIHYPRVIRKIGPILHVWSMRFEAKHRFFKNTIKNFKNITKSLAQKHQMAIAYHWESMPFKSIDCGPVKTVQLIE